MKSRLLALFTLFVIVCTACLKTEKVYSNDGESPKSQTNVSQTLQSQVVEIVEEPEILTLEKVLNAFPTYGAVGTGENDGVYLAEKKRIVATILGDQQNFLRDLYSVLENDTLGDSTTELLRLVDKKHLLDKDDNPTDIIPLKPNNAYLLNRNDLSLRVFVEGALRKMALEAKNDGVTIVASSTYRSYEYQEALYARNVRQLGQEVADRESARPGASQHQLGTVIDFGSITDAFAETKAGKWLDSNAARFGFSLSFPQGYEEVTGYRWECWHYRYVGVDACAFQAKYFNNIQQYMLEFIHLWYKHTSS